MKFSEFLAEHWEGYVQSVGGKIPPAHWRAVEAVLSCRTARLGGTLHYCEGCERPYYFFHSCNHRSCPQCGGTDQALWSAKQEEKLLPVEYYLITITVPEALRGSFLRHPKVCYGPFMSESAKALIDLCQDPKHLGGTPGFTLVFQSWTRRMLYHPHLHILVPAVALAPSGCKLVHPREREYFLPVNALAHRIRERLNTALAAANPKLHGQIPASVWTQDWVVHCQDAGTGRSALRYLAAYVSKSAFNQDRLAGYDEQGRIRLRWKDSADDQWKIEPIEPRELIRRWLLHVLPKGFVAVRHYGWLSSAAAKAYRRVRFLLGKGPLRKPGPAAASPSTCPCCKGSLVAIGRLKAQRGPPLSRTACFQSG